MKTESLIYRILFFLLGMFIMSFGVALSIRSNLGTTPISAPPYVLEVSLHHSVWVLIPFLLMSFCSSAKILILRKDFKPLQLAQIPAVILFGWFIDLSLAGISGLTPPNYLAEWLREFA